MSLAMPGTASLHYPSLNQNTISIYGSQRIVRQAEVDARRQINQETQAKISQLLLDNQIGTSRTENAANANQQLSSGGSSVSTMNDANTISNMGAGTAQSLVQSPKPKAQPAAAKPAAPAKPAASPSSHSFKFPAAIKARLGI